jgi:hypothetical protein
MPANIVKSFAEKSNMSVSQVEKLWDKAKGIVQDEYEIKESNDKFYPSVVGVLKKMLSIEESLWYNIKYPSMVEESVATDAIKFAETMYSLEDILEKNKLAFKAWEKKSGSLWKELGVEDWAEAYMIDQKSATEYKSELEKLV